MNNSTTVTGESQPAQLNLHFIFSYSVAGVLGLGLIILLVLKTRSFCKRRQKNAVNIRSRPYHSAASHRSVHHYESLTSLENPSQRRMRVSWSEELEHGVNNSGFSTFKPLDISGDYPLLRRSAYSLESIVDHALPGLKCDTDGYVIPTTPTMSSTYSCETAFGTNNLPGPNSGHDIKYNHARPHAMSEPPPCCPRLDTVANNQPMYICSRYSGSDEDNRMAMVSRRPERSYTFNKDCGQTFHNKNFRTWSTTTYDGYLPMKPSYSKSSCCLNHHQRTSGRYKCIQQDVNKWREKKNCHAWQSQPIPTGPNFQRYPMTPTQGLTLNCPNRDRESCIHASCWQTNEIKGSVSQFNSQVDGQLGHVACNHYCSGSKRKTSNTLCLPKPCGKSGIGHYDKDSGKRMCNRSVNNRTNPSYVNAPHTCTTPHYVNTYHMTCPQLDFPASSKASRPPLPPPRLPDISSIPSRPSADNSQRLPSVKVHTAGSERFLPESSTNRPLPHSQYSSHTLPLSFSSKDRSRYRSEGLLFIQTNEKFRPRSHSDAGSEGNHAAVNHSTKETTVRPNLSLWHSPRSQDNIYF